MEALKPRYLDISDRLEQDIVSGRLKHGERLPNTKDLSEKFGVSVPTIQQGLARLVSKGLVRRSPKLGSHVDASSLSRRYAVVFGWSPFEIDTRYYSMLLAHFIEAMDAEDIKSDLHVGLIRERFEVRGRQFIEAAMEGKYSCAVLFDASSELTAWAKRQDIVPCVLPATTDLKESARLGASCLLERGVKRPLLVSMMAESFFNDRAHGIKDELEGFAEAFASYGRSFDPESVKYWDSSALEGYTQMRRILESGSLPDGIFIHHDVLTKGVLPALAERGVRIPQDLTLVTHANKGDAFLSSYPLIKVSFDPALIAAETFKFIRARLPELKPGHHIPDFKIKPELVEER
jgi:DNA-binding transcriptional regulator YhcF (GntR family)